MANTINNYGVLNNGASSHLFNRLNGKDASAQSAVVVQNSDGDSVNVSISPEARQTLEKIDSITEELRYIEKQLGNVNFSQNDKNRISEIAEKLDVLHGYNLVETSESYLFLGAQNRPVADTLMHELNTLLSQEEITTEDQTRINDITAELDGMLTSGDKFANHSLQGLSNEQLKEVSNLFINLAEVTKGIEDDKLSDAQMKAATNLSLEIDKIFNEHAALNPAKTLDEDEQSNVNALLQELDLIIEKNGSNGVAEKMRQMAQQTSLNFIQILNGKKASTSNIFTSASSEQSYSSSSRTMIEAQRMIDAYSANQL
tara:strand:+ start:64525 stop:65469 length:945 start_codon:yes stop_codon:yes gene_type:complete